MTHHFPSDTQDRSRKRRALLAGGAILGVSAAATLAAWSDDIWVAASFTASKFNVEASVDGGITWEDYNGTDDPAVGQLAFTMAETGMIPGEPVYAPLSLKVSLGDLDANVYIAETPTEPSGEGPNSKFFNALNLSAYSDVTPSNCNEGELTGALPIGQLENVELNEGIGAHLAFLPKNGSPANICFRVMMDADAGTDAANGELEVPRWVLAAESVTPSGP